MAAIFGGIMMVVGIAGMIGNVATSGVSAANQIPKVQDSITKMQQQTQALEAKYQAAINDLSTLDADVKAETLQISGQIQTEQAKMKLALDNYRENAKRIQIGGVIFLAFIFFMLLLKRVGIFSGIADLF